MDSSAKKSLHNALENQLRRLSQKIVKAEQWSQRISTLRLVVFLTGTAILFYAVFQNRPVSAILIFVLFGTLFGILVYWHGKVDRNIEKLGIWLTTRSAHLARLTLDWDQIPKPEYSENFVDFEHHEYARDLNIIGEHSLLHLIDTALYAGSTEKLIHWLLDNDPSCDIIRTRQILVRELKPMARFRDRLHLNAELAKSRKSESDWDMTTLIKWLGFSREKSFMLPLIILGILALLNIILGIFYLTGLMGPWVAISFLLYLLIYNFNSDKYQGLFDDSYQIEKLLSRFSSILLFLETYPYKKESHLREFCSTFWNTENRPSSFLKKITRLAMAASSQKSELIWLLLNALVPWDLFFAYKLNMYKSELEEKLKHWLERFYELEALNSLANFAWLNPHYKFSEPASPDSGIVFKAESMGHPLIPDDRKVTNSITIQEMGTLLLITGSNMAGKSTFLRTVGINVCLSSTGAPVNATFFHSVPFQLFTSINVIDSLDEGLSHFYAEVKTLKKLLDNLNNENSYPLLFLVDEIFRGTNNRERLTGSAAFLKEVAGKNGIGLISTHDLELANLDREIKQLYNYHFEETIENGKMRFEYKLRPGPCPSTNALKIMALEGLPT